jgi:hypothetical protein
MSFLRMQRCTGLARDGRTVCSYFYMVRQFPRTLLFGLALIGGPGGGYVVPARVDYFYMLEALHKEYKGAVGIAMLNYCNVLFCNV